MSEIEIAQVAGMIAMFLLYFGSEMFFWWLESLFLEIKEKKTDA